MRPEPGYYVSTEGDDDFGPALAMVISGEAEGVGDIYDEEGRRVIALHVSEGRVRRNAEAIGTVGMTLGDRFFTNVLRDYASGFGEKWWREAIQNGVDAGARNIVCNVIERDDGNWEVSCEDDGSGMDQDTLVKAMLTLGGSTKEAGTSMFGGFGRAKELLLLPWIEYTIHTRDLSYTSHNAEPSTLYRAQMRKGTLLKVVMPRDKHATEEEAEAYILKCRLPRVRFTVNGKDVVASLGKGAKKIRELLYERDGRQFKAVIYTDPKNTNYPWDMPVRLNGLFMFDRYVSRKPRDLVLVDLEGAAIDMLTSNRDSFSSDVLRRDVDRYVDELVTEKQQALERKQGLVWEEFVGGERFQADKEEMKRRYEAKMQRANDDVAAVMDETYGVDTTEGLLEAFRKFGERRKEEVPRLPETGGIRLGEWEASITPSLVLDMAKVARKRGSSDVMAMATVMAWRPDYSVNNEIEGFKVPRKFWPQSMTADVRRLVKMWAEVCRLILLLLGSDATFGVGVIFSKNTLGQCVKKHSDKVGRRLDWLLINPFIDFNGDGDAKVIDVREEEVMHHLFAVAVHECTHLANNVSDHDVDFASALTKNIALTMGQEKMLKLIRREVLKYDREVKAELKEAKRTRAMEPERPATRGRATALSGGYDTVIFMHEQAEPEEYPETMMLSTFATWSKDSDDSSLSPVILAVAELKGGVFMVGMLWFRYLRNMLMEISTTSWSTTDVLDWPMVVSRMHEYRDPRGVVEAENTERIHGEMDVDLDQASEIFRPWAPPGTDLITQLDMIRALADSYKRTH